MWRAVSLSLVLLCATVVSTATTRFAYVYWVSDLHVDTHYTPGSPSSCWPNGVAGVPFKVTCCRPFNKALPDSHPASPWGEYTCDAPERLVSYILNSTARDLFPGFPPSAILHTGDFADHHDLVQSVDRNLDAMRTGFTLLRSTGVGHVVPSLGNHDTWPVDQFVPGAHTRMLSATWSLFGPTLPPSAKPTFFDGGYFAMPLLPGADNLTVLVLNALLGDRKNILVAPSRRDVAMRRQWAWAASQLRDARLRNHKVWIAAHIPPNAHDATPDYVDALVNLTRSFPDVVVMQAFAHTHRDGAVIYGNNNPFDGWGWTTASLQPDGKDPSLKIVEVDTWTGAWNDAWHFAWNLTELQRAGPATATAKPYLVYGWRDTYGPGVTPPKAASLAAWLRVAAKSPLVAKAYVTRMYVGNPPDAALGAAARIINESFV